MGIIRNNFNYGGRIIMQAWNIYLKGKLIDTVFYDKDCDKNYVHRSLIDHDGYNPGIQIKRSN